MKKSRKKKRDEAVQSDSVKRYTEGEEEKNPQNRWLGGPESGESRGTAAGFNPKAGDTVRFPGKRSGGGTGDKHSGKP